MKDTLISFETAKLAKEKGFNIPCRYWYYHPYPNTGVLQEPYTNEFDTNSNEINNCTAPTQSLLQKWLREKHKKSIHVFLGKLIGGFIGFGYNVHDLNADDIFDDARKRVYHKAAFDTYESALDDALIETLKTL